MSDQAINTKASRQLVGHSASHSASHSAGHSAGQTAEHESEDTATANRTNKDHSPDLVREVFVQKATKKKSREINGPRGLEPTRYGDWEAKGRCHDF